MLYDCQKMIDISDGSWYDKDRNMSAILRKGDGYGIGTMDVLLSKLDEAIDDMENGRVQTVEEAWAEIDAV